MKSLNVNNACGIDGIGNNILKSCAESLAEPIEILATASLESGLATFHQRGKIKCGTYIQEGRKNLCFKLQADITFVVHFKNY